MNGTRLNMTPFKASPSLFDKGASFTVGSFRAIHFKTMEQAGKDQNKSNENIIASYINQAWKYSTNAEFWSLLKPSARTAAADLESAGSEVEYVPGAQSAAVGPVSKISRLFLCTCNATVPGRKRHH